MQTELADAVAGVNKNLQEITYSSENMSTAVSYTHLGGIVSKDFALNPGVYRIIVESDIANGGIGSGMEISLEAEESTFRAIRGNRATLSADTEHKRKMCIRDRNRMIERGLRGTYVAAAVFSCIWLLLLL